MSRAVRYTCDWFGCGRWINVHADTEGDHGTWETALVYGWSQGEYGDDLCPTHTAWVARMTEISETTA